MMIDIERVNNGYFVIVSDDARSRKVVCADKAALLAFVAELVKEHD